MSDKHEVHQLVIRNMAVLEQAPAIVEEAEKVAGQEPAPFSDMFGTGTEDLEIFI